MADLMIRYSYGNWYAMISNSQIDYKFAGATAEDQIVQVQAFQNAMADGGQSVVDGMSTFFSNIPEDQEADVFAQLFQTTDELYYQGALVFEAAEDSFLIDDIVEAGEALAAFL
ncbi:MAG: hypothetical protein ACKVOJ_13605 [Sphingomonadaceae bacterium]